MTLVIRIYCNELDDSALSELNEVFKEHPGSDELILDLFVGDRVRRVHSRVGIKVTRALLSSARLIIEGDSPVLPV